MILSELLSQISELRLRNPDLPVEKTAAAWLQETLLPGATLEPAGDPSNSTLTLGVVDADIATTLDSRLGELAEWTYARITPDRGIELYASHTWFLFRLVTRLVDDWLEEETESFAEGKIATPSFKHLRPAWDSLLNNHARTAHHFDPEDHIREMARLGYTHVEVNGYAATFPAEQPAPDELLYRFYTYCPALDQFVYSKLNKGIYPFEYLQANLNKLKHSAQLAEKYGLRAGILSFEPRSVPEKLLERYPMLRGARVDHPLRSFRPRYNLTTAHPVVLEHYSEMLEKIMRAAPNIDYMVLWTNDSGAGFEYTSSLYVGRNGGGYVIREFKGDDAIIEAAAANIIRFMKTIRDAGRRVNPDFKCVLRSEMFYDERDKIWEGTEPGLEMEVHSLAARGFDLGYAHPSYDWHRDFLLSSLFNQFAEEEKPLKEKLEANGSGAHIYFSPGTFWNQEPILAPAYPKLVFEKLSAMNRQEVQNAVSMTGTIAPEMAPYNINQEVIRAFQHDAQLDFDTFLLDRATKWAGEERGPALRDLWMLADDAYRAYPPPVSVHSVWGVWYRVLVRPFVPNYDLLSEADRAYYEDFHLGHANNVVRVDFRREINFDFCTPDFAQKCRTAITENVFPSIEKAVAQARETRDQNGLPHHQREVFAHLYDRLEGTRCWYRTQRNIAAWIEGVHGYMEADNDEEKERCRKLVRATVLDEKENARALLQHCRTAETTWMLTSAVGETTFIYGDNFAENLERKIEIMEGREDDEPFVDPNFMWRVPGMNC